jgi:hypothetical protein
LAKLVISVQEAFFTFYHNVQDWLGREMASCAIVASSYLSTMYHSLGSFRRLQISCYCHLLSSLILLYFLIRFVVDRIVSGVHQSVALCCFIDWPSRFVTASFWLGQLAAWPERSVYATLPAWSFGTRAPSCFHLIFLLCDSRNVFRQFRFSRNWKSKWYKMSTCDLIEVWSILNSWLVCHSQVELF